MLDLTRRGLFGILAGILTTPLRSLWPARTVTDDTIVYENLIHMWSRLPAVSNGESLWARNTYNAAIENITWDKDGLMKIGRSDG